MTTIDAQPPDRTPAPLVPGPGPALPGPLRYYGTALLAALIFCGLSAFVVGTQWKQTQAAAQTAVLNTARILSNEVGNSFAQVDALLRSAGRRFISAGTRGPADLARFEAEVRAEVHFYPLVERIGFTGTDGVTAFNTGFDAFDQRRPDLSDRDYFSRARAGEAGLLFSGPLRAKLGGERSLILARRLIGPAGEFRGVVFAVVTCEAIGRYFSHVDLGPGGVISLLNAELVQVVRYPPLESDPAANPAANPNGTPNATPNATATANATADGRCDGVATLRALLQQDPELVHAVYRAVGPGGALRLYASARFNQAPFYLTVGRAAAHAMQSWRASTAWLGLLCLVISLTAVWVAHRLLGSARQLHRYNAALEARVAERTAELAAEKGAVERSEARLAAVLDASPVAMAIYNDRQEISSVNPAFVGLFGYTREAVPDLDHWWPLAYPDPAYREALIGEWQARLATAARTGAPFQPMEAEIRCADGTRRTVLGHWAPLAEPGLHLVALVDITPQRNAARRMELLLETASDGVHILDEAGRLVECSDSFAQMLGYTRAQARGLKVTDWEAEIARERFPALIWTLMEAPATFETRHRRRDGTLIEVEIHSRGITLDGQRFLYASSRDITERKRDEQALKQAREAAEAASAAKSAFLAHMSHEIRTPMNAVLGLAQVLERGALDPGQRDLVTQIGAAGRSLLGILNDILDFSKIEAGQLALDARPFALADLLARVESLLGPTARGKGLVLSITAPPADTAAVVGDPLRLEQVLVNLVGNAIKFTERGEVRLEAAPPAPTDAGARWRFAVSDTGIGVSPEALAGLFSPFTQADDSITRRFGGTGLGLSISKRLVELMDGVIGADSRAGFGSTFWFDLPLAWAGEAPPARPPGVPVPPGPRLAGVRLLVVDDSPMNRTVAERMLALEGATTVTADDGQQALERLRAEPGGFDAVLMDLQMPVMDGLTAVRLIRGEPGLDGLPVIALTAGVMAAQQEAALAAGMNDVLTKPLDLDRMADLLSLWVGPGSRGLPAAREGAAPSAPAASPPAPAGAAESFPAIPGIDPERAAGFLSGNRRLFLDLLGRFIEESAAGVALARRTLDAGDRETAARQMHSIKGNAGTIGAVQLMQAAAWLESAIAAQTPGVDERLAALDGDLGALAAAAAPWRRAPDAAPASAAAPAVVQMSEAVAAELERLRAALRDQDLGAIARFEGLRPWLAATLGEEVTVRLGRAVRGLQFAEALVLLDRHPADGPDAH